MAELSYNNSRHSAATLTPFFANYGFHPRMSLLPTSPDSTIRAADSYVERLQVAQTVLQCEVLKARKAMETSANRRRRRAPPFVPSNKVWLLPPTWAFCNHCPGWLVRFPLGSSSLYENSSCLSRLPVGALC